MNLYTISLPFLVGKANKYYFSIELTYYLRMHAHFICLFWECEVEISLSIDSSPPLTASPHKVHHQAFVFLRILVTRRQKLIQCDSYTGFWWKKWAKIVQLRGGNFPYLANRSKIQLKILKIFYFPLCWPIARFGEFLLWMIITKLWKKKKP
jgi:hypothetical protein